MRTTTMKRLQTFVLLFNEPQDSRITWDKNKNKKTVEKVKYIFILFILQMYLTSRGLLA